MCQQTRARLADAQANLLFTLNHINDIIARVKAYIAEGKEFNYRQYAGELMTEAVLLQHYSVKVAAVNLPQAPSDPFPKE